MLPRSRQLSALLVTFSVILAPSCADEDPKAPRLDPTTTAPTTTAPTTTESPEAADEAALRQLAEDWYDQVGATYSGRSDSETVSEYLVDPYLGQFRDQLEHHRATGNTIEPSTESGHDIESIEVRGDDATVVECIVNADLLVGPDGEIVNDEVIAQRISSTAVRTDAGWRFNTRELLDERNGATECES